MTKLTYKITNKDGIVIGSVNTFAQAEVERAKGNKVIACYSPIDREPVKLTPKQEARRIKI